MSDLATVPPAEVSTESGLGSRDRSSIARAAALIMLGSVVSRLLGVARDQTIAWFFGAGATTDAYRAASRVPQMVYDLLVGGSVSAALVPTFTGYAEGEDRGELWRVVNSVLAVAMLVLAAVVVVLMVFSRQAIYAVATVFTQQENDLASLLLRVMLPALIFLGASAVMTGALYSLRQFAFAAFASASFNAGIVLAVVLLARYLDAVSLAAGVLAGAFAQAALQWYGLRRAGARFSLRPRLWHPALPRILRLYLPVALGLVVSVLAQVLDLNLAARTGEGSIAVLGFATTLVQLPLGLVATATSAAVLPTLSAFATSGDDGHFMETLAYGFKLVLVAILPATAGLIVLREPVISLLFEHGRFGADDTARTSLAFLAYSIQLPFAAIDQLLIFAFYARKDTVTPVVVGVLGVFVYLAVALPLLRPLGMPSLALANSAQNSAHAVILLLLLFWRVGTFQRQGMGQMLGKSLLSAAAMSAATYGMLEGVRVVWPGGSLGLAVQIGVSGAVGVGVYALAVVLLRVEEGAAAWSMVKSRIGL